MNQLASIEKLLRERNWTLRVYMSRNTVTVEILDLDHELVDSFTAPNLIVAFTALADWSTR
jgi:hypothetical protein